MQLVKSCVCYLRKRMKENQVLFQERTAGHRCCPPMWVGFAISFFFPRCSCPLHCCVCIQSLEREREKKKKRFWNSSQSTHSFLFHRLFKIWFLVVVVVVDKRKGLLKNQIVKYREEGKKNEFFFSLFWGCVCVCGLFLLYIYFFFACHPHVWTVIVG